MSLKAAIHRKRMERTAADLPAGMLGMRDVLIQLAGEVVQAHIPQIEKEIIDALITYTKKHIDEKIPHLVGEKGDQGLKGDKGDKGEQGATGEKGDKGDAGKDGAAGSVGLKGDTGNPGENGSPDQPDEVVTKFNKSKIKISPDRVEGLSAELKYFTRVLRERGGSGAAPSGGMGNVQHQEIVVTSATTSVTANSKISGGGYAIWAYYNGQQIHRGTHFTVNSDNKTLALLFTPDDPIPGQNNKITLIYIRS